MTLEEAIKILKLDAEGSINISFEKHQKALRLGIEALKFFKDLKDRGALPADVRLPGETEERTIRRHGRDIRGDYLYEEAQK